MADHIQRLEAFLHSRGRQSDMASLTADASTREYYRLHWGDSSAVACVYAEANDPAEEAYLDVTRLFSDGGLPVAQVYDFDLDLGVVIQEDLGDRVLREILIESKEEERRWLLDEAITMIARIQTITPLAYQSGSVASKLRFDTEKLLWELNFFKEHYFGTYLKRPLTPAEDVKISAEFKEIAEDLDGRARVLCHRDFHTANLMLDPHDKMRIIDHQDARIGSPAYDLVSLLLDRITVPPSPEWLADKRLYFLDVRRRLGLEKIEEEIFAQEFRLQTIQRCLKAAGTFSYQSVNRGKTYFIPFIKPMFAISLRAITNLSRFPALHEVLLREVE